eukprot:Sro935_g221960.2  (364) ;mRNA; r:8102-9193
MTLDIYGKLTYPAQYFLAEAGRIASCLMYEPHRGYILPILDEAHIFQSLDTLMHPKHIGDNTLHRLVPGFPDYEKIPDHIKKKDDIYLRPRDKDSDDDHKEEGKEIEGKCKEGGEQQTQKECSNEKKDEGEDPDRLIRAAAKAGVYRYFMNDLRPFSSRPCDDDREAHCDYLELLCEKSTRALMDQLTPNDKAQIDAALGQEYNPDVLDMTMECTGAEEFDKVFPLPPPEFRLDVAEVLPLVHRWMMERLCTQLLTPRAAAILTAALSAVLYQAHLKNLEEESDEESGAEGDSESEEGSHVDGVSEAEDGAESDGAESDGAESDGAEIDDATGDGAESVDAKSDGAESDAEAEDAAIQEHKAC